MRRPLEADIFTSNSESSLDSLCFLSNQPRLQHTGHKTNLQSNFSSQKGIRHQNLRLKKSYSQRHKQGGLTGSQQRQSLPWTRELTGSKDSSKSLEEDMVEILKMDDFDECRFFERLFVCGNVHLFVCL